MQRYNNHHEFTPFSFLQIPGLNALFIAHSIRKFAMSLIELFGSLYIFSLFKNQYGFMSKESWIILVLIYYALQKMSILLFSYPTASIVTRIGFRYSMLIGNTILAVKLLFLIFAQKKVGLLIPSALLAGLYIPLYWLPYHSIFVVDGKNKELGHELSQMDALRHLASIVAPFLGGLIIVEFGFEALYTIALILILCAATPLFFMRHHIHTPLPSLEKLWHGFWQSGFKKSFIAFSAAGAESQIQGVLWPFFLFFLVGHYETIGGLTSAVMFITFLFLFFVGKLTDRRNRAKLMRIGSITNGLSWLVKIFAKTIPQLFAVDLFYNITRIFYTIPFDAILYTKADHKGTLQYLLWREWALYAGRLAVLILLILLVSSGVNWTFGFVLAAIASFLTATITT